LWRCLPGVGEDLLHPSYRGMEPTIMLAAYPQAVAELIDEGAESQMGAIIELVSRVRSIRSEMNIRPSEEIEVFISSTDMSLRGVFEASMAQMMRLTRAARISFRDSMDEVPRASVRAVLAGGAEVAVPLEGLIDFAQEREKLARELEKLQKESEKLEAQLANPQFTERAPAEKAEGLRQRVTDIAQRTKALGQILEALAE